MTTPRGSTSPAPPQEPDLADLPAFDAPRRMPTNDPLDPDVTRTGPSDGAAPMDDSWGQDQPGDPGFSSDFAGDVDEPTQTTTSRAAGPSPAFIDGSLAEELEKPIGALVGIASLGVHYARRAPRDTTLWIADDEDVAMIAGPLSRIAARHSPVGAGEASDLIDGLTAGLGVANYGLKNIRAQAELAHRYQAPPQPPPDEPTPYQPVP